MKATVVFLLLLTGLVNGQVNNKLLKDNGVYLTAKDYQDRLLTHAFNKTKGIKFLENKKLLIVIKSFDSSYLFYYDQVWGYRKDGVDWRVFNELVYQVDQTNKICIYSLPPCVACLTTPPLYFSVDLNSPLHPLTRNYLTNAYHANTGFVNKIRELPWTTSVMKRDKKTHQYRFIDWL
ncbi:MAG: hypothetical protein V4557_18155 [Bacteroidota bacterium]